MDLAADAGSYHFNDTFEGPQNTEIPTARVYVANSLKVGSTLPPPPINPPPSTFHPPCTLHSSEDASSDDSWRSIADDSCSDSDEDDALSAATEPFDDCSYPQVGWSIRGPQSHVKAFGWLACPQHLGELAKLAVKRPGVPGRSEPEVSLERVGEESGLCPKTSCPVPFSNYPLQNHFAFRELPSGFVFL